MAVGGNAVDVGTGTTITFGTSGYSANIESVSWSGLTRNEVDTTHMGSAEANNFGGRSFISGDLVDAGELAIVVQYNPDTDPPIDAAAETITVTWPKYGDDASAANWACSGFLTNFEINDPLEDKMTATATVKFTGSVTITQSVAG